MAINIVSVPRTDLAEPAEQERPFDVKVPIAFTAVVALLLACYDWPWKWLISGTPLLCFFIFLGASEGYRILPNVPLWTLLVTVNFAYSICATSWLLFGFLVAAMYTLIFFTCLFQFDLVAKYVRRSLRKTLRQLDFVNDQIAFFDLPALEIDTDVDGLMVIRGVTFSFSSLTLVVHGIEVGIKLSDDMELAISTEKVTIPLFRKIVIEDCFAGIKGGQYEMTFGDMAEDTHDANGDALMVENTPLLQAAAAHGVQNRPKMVKMTSRMTDGETMKDVSATGAFRAMTQISPDEGNAKKQYDETIKWIESTNTIQECRKIVKERSKTAAAAIKADPENKTEPFDVDRPQDMRAAICSQMHDKPSVPHAPKRSIKVTTLQNLSPPKVRRFMHRLPMLLRLLLNPLAYFHPVTINSITAAGSGRWASEVLSSKVFKEYAENNADLRRLEARISAWLADANFAIQLNDIKGIAQVPFLSAFDILCYLAIGDVVAYRTLPKQINLNEILRLGGADATFTIPSFLLPHHEHLLPAKPDASDKEEIEEKVEEADGKPKTVQAEKELEQAEKDEANVKISAHARLPLVLDQELLDFVAALVKATKVVELEKAPNAMDEEVKTFSDFTSAVGAGMKNAMKKAAVDGIVNDRLIAKLVGKVTRKLEEVVGDVGYSGDIPVALEDYRLPEGHPELSKLLA